VGAALVSALITSVTVTADSVPATAHGRMTAVDPSGDTLRLEWKLE
jgi:hypothetical protein